jgi:catechol 2,3-dioxygenase-like lactoylglutathione lyase family enzyme
MALPVKLDHCVVHVSAWERSNAFYRDVLGEVARLPVQPGNSDICFEWKGPIADAIAHLSAHGIAVERGPMQRFGAKGQGTSVYLRDPDGSLMEFISYAS